MKVFWSIAIVFSTLQLAYCIDTNRIMSSMDMEMRINYYLINSDYSKNFYQRMLTTLLNNTIDPYIYWQQNMGFSLGSSVETFPSLLKINNIGPDWLKLSLSYNGAYNTGAYNRYSTGVDNIITNAYAEYEINNTSTLSISVELLMAIEFGIEWQRYDQQQKILYYIKDTSIYQYYNLPDFHSSKAIDYFNFSINIRSIQLYNKLFTDGEKLESISSSWVTGIRFMPLITYDYCGYIDTHFFSTYLNFKLEGFDIILRPMLMTKEPYLNSIECFVNYGLPLISLITGRKMSTENNILDDQYDNLLKSGRFKKINPDNSWNIYKYLSFATFGSGITYNNNPFNNQGFNIEVHFITVGIFTQAGDFILSSELDISNILFTCKFSLGYLL